MIVELAGLPGSGKSTIARRLAAESAMIDRQELSPAWGELLRHPILATVEGCRWEAVGRGTGWPAWLNLWLRGARQRGMTSAGHRTVLLEEGIVHHVWRSIFLHPALEAAPWRGLVSVPHPLLVLELDGAVRHGRVTGKLAKGKVNRLLVAAGPHGDAWYRGEALLERILAEAARHRVVVKVSTQGTVEATAVRVREALARLR